MTDTAPAASDPLGTLPRRARYRGRGVRIIGYDPNPALGFHIVDTDDSTRWVPRSALIFYKSKATPE